MARLLARFAAIGATPADTEHERLQRGLLVGLSLLISVLAIFWGLAYIVFGEPLGGLAFANPREALRWFVAYLVLILAVGIFGGRLRSANNLPAGLVGAMFIVNITAVSIVVFVALYAFVHERDRAFAAVHRLFGQYLSPQIVHSLLSDPGRAALGGENREVTALFADLAGFTPFTESRPPRETVLALNRYFSAVVPVVFANGGTIIQFAGDAIVAVWNAPVEQPATL